MWRLIAIALGTKGGSNDREADIIACLRGIFVLSSLLTNLVIVAGVFRHWNS